MIPLGVLAQRQAAPAPVVFVDDFNRAGPPLGVPWVAISGSWQIDSNQAASGSDALNLAYADFSLAPDSYVEVDIAQVGGASMGVMIRTGVTPETGYMWRYNGSNATQIIRADAAPGTYTTLGSPYYATLTAPFRLRLEAQGTIIRGYVNGTLRKTVTDSTYSTGVAAMRNGGSTSTRFDNFAAGSL